jgi:hypothetical protein
VGNPIDTFLQLDQKYGNLFPTIRAGIWIAIALFLWFIIVKFFSMPGNGAKYLWRLLLIPAALLVTTLPMVDYFKGFGYMWAELLLIPGVIYLVCLFLVTIRLFRHKNPSSFTSHEIAEMAKLTSVAAALTAENARITAERAIAAATYADRVALVAARAAENMRDAAADVAKELIVTAALEAQKLLNKEKVAAQHIIDTAALVQAEKKDEEPPSS